MSENIEDFNYNVGIYDVVCRYIRKKVEEEAGKKGAYGVGVYTDRFCEEELMTKPMKNLDERMEIAKCFEGVDFVFSVDTKDSKHIEKLAKVAYMKYLEEQRKEEETKKYKVGFVIGSFDVFHAGHLENLMLAKKMCDRLVAVLKTDERILKNKNKCPRQTTVERAAVLRFMKLIDDILYMDIDTTRKDIVTDLMDLYKGIKLNDIVAIFGSDLQEKEEPFITTDWAGINVVFTDRNPEKMKIVSSSNYQKICDQNGGIGNLERVELESLR